MSNEGSDLNDHREKRARPHILVAATGSVAACKIPLLVEHLVGFATVRVVTTTSALHFFDREALPEQVELFTDKDEWKEYKRGDPVLHIEIRKWADIMVIAPLDANSLAKIATGICDNLVTCVVRAWRWNDYPLILCPSMNTFMWEHPLTLQQLDTICSFSKKKKVSWIPTVEKTLACGDVGLGAMAEVQTIVAHINTVLERATEEGMPCK